MKLLEGILVLDFSQYLAGPSCALRLADLGARVIKVERPGTGDNARKTILKNLVVGEDSLNFHAINRNKESICANMKDPQDLEMLKKLISKADVMIENFRPGVMKKNGLDYDSVKEWNPGIVYATVTGYGTEGPWVKKPGQDLLIQSLSGLAWLNGNGGDPPSPFGLSVIDSYAGVHMAEGIMAALFRRFKTGKGGRVEVSLLESALDMQFEGITTYLNDGHKLPVRASYNNAHPYLGAPYGIYQTKDGYIAIAMGSLKKLGECLETDLLDPYDEENDPFDKRDEIKRKLGTLLKEKDTAEWLEKLEAGGYWAGDVLSWRELFETPEFQQLQFVQEITCMNGSKIETTRCPIRVDGQILTSPKCAPELGADTESIIQEFALREGERA